MMKHGTLSGKILLAACAGLCAFSLPAQSARDLRFSQVLNEMDLYDYSEYFLQSLLKQAPEDPSLINAQMIDTYLSSRKEAEAKKLFATLKKGTEAYARAQASFGIRAYFAGKPSEARPLLVEAVDYCKKNNLDRKSWEKAIGALYQIYQQEGNSREIQAMTEWFNSGGEQNDREKLYTNALIKLSAVENAATAEKEAIRKWGEAVKRISQSGTDAEKKALNEFTAAKGKIMSDYNSVANRKGVKAEEIDKARIQLETACKPIADAGGVNMYLLLREESVRGTRANSVKTYLKRDDLNPEQIKALKETRPDDWMTDLFNAMYDLEGVQWGGRDLLTAYSRANIGRGFYLMGQYEEGLKFLLKEENAELFQACDEALEKEKQLNTSPGADAKMWEAYCYIGLAEVAAKDAKKQKDEAKFYTRAFKALGKFLKTYVGHKSAPQCYIQFTKVVDKLSELKPNQADKLAAAKAAIPVPEMPKGEEEKLIPVMTEQAWKEKNYAKVIEDLLPVLQKNRTKDGAPEVASRLVMSYVYQGELLPAMALAWWMSDSWKDSPYTSGVLLNSGNILWEKAFKMVEDAKGKDKKQAVDPKVMAESIAIKDSAVDFYRKFLEVDIGNLSAADVALRLAREYYNRANDLGKQLNKQTDQTLKAQMKEEWIQAYDNTIKNYYFIVNNFGNDPKRTDEAYTMIAECYVMTERYEDAAKVYKTFCAAGSENKPVLFKAKENISECLYRMATGVEEEARTVMEEAAAIIIPAIPETPAKPEAPAAAAAPAPAPAGAEAAAAAPTAAPAADPQADYQKALAEYEARLKEIEKLTADAKVQTEKKQQREAVAAELKEKAQVLYKEAIASLEEFLTTWLAQNQKYANDPEIRKTLQRSAALKPWLYDGVNDTDNAIKAFNEFIKNYPDDKNIPAYMMRVGVLYTDKNKDTEAQEVLRTLSEKYPNSKEGKNARFFLARSLYNNGSYEKSLAIFKEIFDSKLIENLSITNFRWIASTLAECPSAKYSTAAAEYSLKASEQLLKKVRKPEYKEWVGELRAIEFRNDPKTADKYFKQIEQKLLLDAGNAALRMKKYPEAIKYYSDIVKLDSNSPFFYQLYIARADAYSKQGKFADARKDLARVSNRAIARSKTKQPDLPMYNKAQTLIGMSYLGEKEYQKAYAIFTMVATPAFSNKDTTPVKSDDPADDAWKYIEDAIYYTAYTSAILGRKDVANMVDKYKKYYPKGRFLTEINNLPPADPKYAAPAPAAAK